jgi:hypothetical protein
MTPTSVLGLTLGIKHTIISLPYYFCECRMALETEARLYLFGGAI